jgi:hypothetical protein
MIKSTHSFVGILFASLLTLSLGGCSGFYLSDQGDSSSSYEPVEVSRSSMVAESSSSSEETSSSTSLSSSRTSSSSSSSRTSSSSSSSRTTSSSKTVSGNVSCSYSGYYANSSYLALYVRFYNGTNVDITAITSLSLSVAVDGTTRAAASFNQFTNSSMSVGSSLNWTLTFGSGLYDAAYWSTLSGTHQFGLTYDISYSH